MSSTLAIPTSLVLLGRAFAVLHVTEVVFAAAVVRVLLDEVVFVGQLEYDREEAEQREDDIVVQSLGEDFDLRNVCFKQVWLIVGPDRVSWRM
jgi:hypothetical protein